jgi:hypothetical protein
MRNPIKYLIFVTMLLLFSGCSPKIIGGKEKVNERLNLEVRTSYIVRLDTIPFKLPKLRDSKITRDSTSYLENEFAHSTAAILPDGSLYHDLEINSTEVPITVPAKEIVRDSIVYRDKEVEVEVPVPVEVEKELSLWQKILLKFGYIGLFASGYGVAKFVMWLRRKILK